MHDILSTAGRRSATLILVLILSSGAQAAVVHGFDWPSSIQGELHGAWIAARTCHFTFGYFYLSAIVFLLLAILRGTRSSRVLAVKKSSLCRALPCGYRTRV